MKQLSGFPLYFDNQIQGLLRVVKDLSRDFKGPISLI